MKLHVGVVLLIHPQHPVRFGQKNGVVIFVVSNLIAF